MTQEPELQERAAQPYAGIRTSVTMDGLSAAVDGAFGELFGWLGGRAIEMAGPPFIRYHVIDMQGELEIEFGVPADVPVDAAGDDGGRIRPGILPAGQYAVLRHVGPYDGLIAGNAALLDWARERAVALDSWDTGRGTAWRSRVEHYLTNPATEPDPAKWQVDIAYLTTGG
jgi:effector-binding domain-containing protein